LGLSSISMFLCMSLLEIDGRLIFNFGFLLFNRGSVIEAELNEL